MFRFNPEDGFGQIYSLSPKACTQQIRFYFRIRSVRALSDRTAVEQIGAFNRILIGSESEQKQRSKRNFTLAGEM